MRILYIFLTFLLLSCTKRIAVQTHHIGPEHLASYYVGTPDPLLDRPPIGQRLVISWTLSEEDLDRNDLHLELKVRLRNRKEDVVKIPLTQRRGFYFYDVLNREYCESGGILTYKVDMMGNGCLLEEWKHPLWAELITFEQPPTTNH